MWIKLLSIFLKRLIRQGSLIVVYPDGRSIQYGDGSTPSATMRFHAHSLPRKLLINPELTLGEAYMDGTLTVDQDDFYGLIELLVVNLTRHPDVWHHRWQANLRRFHRRLAQFNPAGLSATWRIITTCPARCMTCFWTPTANTPAPISANRATPWKPPKETRNR